MSRYRLRVNGRLGNNRSLFVYVFTNYVNLNIFTTVPRYPPILTR